MSRTTWFLALALASSSLLAQGSKLSTGEISIESPFTLPIVFLNNISASHSHAGDVVLAKTTQIVRLGNGAVIPRGSRITGHVVLARPFIYNKTPYARQKESILTVHFDSVEVGHESIPLAVMVRAMADPITSQEAQTPINHDIDPSGMTTQIGGDQRYPWSAPVVSSEGDVVAYSRRDGVYAHLIANGPCNASSVEVSVGIYSASACGLYGFTDVSLREFGSVSNPSTFTLSSTHVSPKIWKYSTAILEALPGQNAVALRR